MTDDLRAFGRFLDDQGVRLGSDMALEFSDEERDLDSHDYLTVCAVCDIPLNRFTSGDGETWIHSQSWKRFDHEPESKRVPRSEAVKNAVCDFCGRNTTVAWAVEGQHMRQMSGNFGGDFGTKWAACWDCYDLIVDDDLDGLIERVMQHSAFAKQGDAERREVIRDSLYGLHGAFLPSIHTHTYLGPPVEVGKLTARQMPKIKDGLSRFWDNPKAFERIALKPEFQFRVPGVHAGADDSFSVRYPSAGMPREVFHKHTRHLLTGLDAAEMYWISRDFTLLATMAGKDLTEIRIDREALPSPFGFLMWETPIGQITRPHGVAGIRAMSWTLVPGGVWMNLYIQAEDGDPINARQVPELRAEWGFLLCPNIGAGLRFDDIGEFSDADAEMDYARTMLATWFLMAQPGVATEERAPVDKALIRAYKRAGRPVPEVRLINLRKQPRRSQPVDGAVHEGPKLKYKRFTSGHWKNQFYGPQRGQRKLIYISPYLSGGDLPWRPDAPATVKVLR